MMPSNSPTEKPLYSYVVATSRISYRQSQYQIDTSSSPDPSSPDSSSPDSSTPASPSPASSSPVSSLSVESDNDVAVAQRHGITDMSHLGTERFQIDRRKLEHMMKSPSDIEGINSAERYFDKIMKITDTYITWPRNLKVGARNRKDPYVRVVGKPHDINWAKGLLLATVGTKGPLFKMRMTISSCDHPHIIGRAGNNINRIMQETDTHIHFPDTCRRNLAEKSNQVSLYGTFENLELSRIQLRLSAPLMISFDLLIGAKHDTQYMKMLETNYNVKVIFMSAPYPGSYTVLVKGYENEAAKVKEAVQLLLKSMCGFMANQIPVYIKLDACQQFKDIIAGEGNTILLNIMEATGTKIILSNRSDGNHHPQIIISGAIDGVYKAKQELINCLPMDFIFYVPNNPAYITEIMSLEAKYGVRITMKHNKKRDKIVSVNVKAMEKFITNIHGAYQEILDMQITSSNEPEIPKAYLLAEPSFRRSLENNPINFNCLSDPIAIEIWAPIEPNSQNNFLIVSPSTEPIDINTWNNFGNNEAPLEIDHAPLFEDQRHEAESRATLSPDSTDSSEAAYQEGRRSSDWMMMKEVAGHASEDEGQHYECDFDNEDLEVAFIFLSSLSHTSPLFMVAPGAERHAAW